MDGFFPLLCSDKQAATLVLEELEEFLFFVLRQALTVQPWLA